MPRFINSLKIFSCGSFMSSYTDVIILISKPSWPGALFLLSNLNDSSNSSSLNAVSFNVVFTEGFGPMLTKILLNFSAIESASFVSIL